MVIRPWETPLPPVGMPATARPPVPPRLVYHVTVAERADLSVGIRYAAGTALHIAGQPRFLALAAELVEAGAEHLVFVPDPTGEASETSRGVALRQAPAAPPLVEPDVQMLVLRARQFGIVGHGGAGFPLWKKLEQAATRRPSVLIVNAVECEPGLAGDAALLSLESGRVARGVAALVNLYAPERVLLAAHDSASGLAARVGCELLSVARGYPSGDERQLCAQIGRPLGFREHALDAGVLVMNAATVAALADAVAGIAPNRRYVTVHGPAAGAPKVVAAWLGTPLVDLLAQSPANPDSARSASGASSSGTFALRVGGKMMGIDVPSWWGEANTLAPASCVSQLSTGLYLSWRVHGPAARPCINCQRCDDVCPQRLPVAKLWQALDTGDAQSVSSLAAGCTQCRCCDVVCPSGLPLAEAFGTARRAAFEQARLAQLASWYEGRYQAHLRREQERGESRARRRERRDPSARPQLAELLSAGRRRRRRPGA